MRQVVQSLSDGQTSLIEVPSPTVRRGGLLIETTRSLISAGTERMLVDFGRAGWFDKARQQPDKVRQVLDKMSTDGVLPTIAAVRSKLDQPLALGYCNVGIVAEVGAEVHGFSCGDRVISNGAHAQMVAVPRNLCARVPAQVTDDEAVFAVVGAIALQGLRLAMPTLGERFVVTGLGLIGLLAVQLLRAAGCRVLGIDPDPARAQLARSFGAEAVALDRGENPLEVAAAFSAGLGVDGVLITAATHSNEPVRQGAQMCRQRGRIVLVGVAGLELNRADFYQKELSFQVSCSYGPGRHDAQYEEQGHDYPFGLVRWTEGRNFEAILDMLAAGRLQVRPLITHRFAFEAAPAAYELLATGAEPHLGILLEYPVAAKSQTRARTVLYAPPTAREAAGDAAAVAFIGAGNYARRVLIPTFAANGARLVGIASEGGVTAAHCARKYGFQRATTDAAGLIAADDVRIVVIATRHDSHARLVVQALQAGKHVFVEKPLAINAIEIDAIAAAQQMAVAKSGAARAAAPRVMVGFNRRFAPHVLRMRALLSTVRAPKTLIVTVNAGAIPASHWTRDPLVGGGRIIGEGCHFVDLLRFLADCPIVAAGVPPFGGGPREGGEVRDEDITLILQFADGSRGIIHYLASGHVSYPKERIEVFCAGRILQLDNFRRLRGFGWPAAGTMRLWRQDKGQMACVRGFLTALERGEDAPIAFAELLEVAQVTVELAEAARR